MKTPSAATTIHKSDEDEKKYTRKERRNKSFLFSNPLKTTINFHFNGKAMTICGVSKWKIKAMNLQKEK